MNIRENDPILSEDGSRIVAYWAVSDMPEDVTFYSFPVLLNMESAAAWEEMADKFEQPPIATLGLYAKMPDRHYWQLRAGSPDGWMNDLRFKRVAEKGSPAAMVEAYDLVMGDKERDRYIDPQAMLALEHVRGYWKHRAERSSK